MDGAASLVPHIDRLLGVVPGGCYVATLGHRRIDPLLVALGLLALSHILFLAFRF